MLGKHQRLVQLASGIALAVSIAVVAASSARATDWYAYYTHGAGTSATAPDAVRRYLAGPSAPQGTAFAWDRLGANRQPARPTINARQADPTGSTPNTVSPGLWAAVQSNHVPATPEASLRVAVGTGFSWGDAGIGAGLAAGFALMLLLGAMRLRTSRRGVLTT